MRVTKELREYLLWYIAHAKGSVRQAAKSLDVKWWDIHDALNRPEVMSKDRLYLLYRDCGIDPPELKVYYRPAVDKELGEMVKDFLKDNPEVDINDIISAGMEAITLVDDPDYAMMAHAGNP